MKKIYTRGLASLVVTLAKKQTTKKIGFVAGLLLAFGMTAFSQTSYYLRTDTATIVNKKAAKIDPSLLVAWTTDPAGTASGTAPADFTSDNQIFYAQTNGYTLGSVADASLTISGKGSKLVVGPVGATDSAITFALGNFANFTGTVDVAPFTPTNKSSVLYIQQGNTSTITLGTLGVGSTVRYAGNSNGTVQQVIPYNYYTLSLAANSTTTSATVTLPTATVGIAGGFTSRVSNIYGSTLDFNGGDGQIIPAGTYYNLTVSGNKTVPDSLKGAINVAGTFTDNTTGPGSPVVSYVITNTAGKIATAGSTLNFLGLNPQTVGNDKTFFNVSFSEGYSIPVTAFDYANSTITLAQANGDLKVGQKIGSNTLTLGSNSLYLDTAATITAINDTVITLSSPTKLRLTISPYKHVTGVIDTVYATSWDAATQTITLDPSVTYPTYNSLGNDTIKGAIITTNGYITAQNANVLTLKAALINIHNPGLFAFRNATPATKTISGNLHLIGTGAFSSTVPVATEGSTVILEGQGNRIGGGNNWSYNNLLINQVAAASTVVSAPAYVSGTLTLQSGKITSTSGTRYLILNENATFTAPSVDSSYVTCPFAKKFNSTTPFTYYMGATIGGVSSGRKITITPKTADAKTYTVTYAATKTNNSTRIDYNTLNSIDLTAWYNVALSANTGTDSSAKISADFYPTAAYQDSSIVLAHYNIIGTDTSYKAESAPVIFTGQTPLTLTTADYDATFGRYVFGTAGPIPVPVKLSAVAATALVNKTIKINWSSANEVSVGKYVVEGSVDGVKFSAKGTVAVKGSSSYSFIDATPSAGVNYYRIKVIDIDGKVIYSSIVSAKQAVSINNISVSPNPVKNKQLSFALSTDAANYTLKVTNILGKTVVAKTIAHNGGTATYNVSLPTSALAGTYFVQLSSGNNQLTKTIVVE